jgi:hypothetical protein
MPATSDFGTKFEVVALEHPEEARINANTIIE